MTADPDHRPGTHLLADLYGGPYLADALRIEAALTQAARAAGARVLATHFHVFSDSGGVTGMALLAESHISIHTWPELGYAAVDIFICGAADARAALRVVEAVLATDRSTVTEIARGPDQRNQ